MVSEQSQDESQSITTIDCTNCCASFEGPSEDARSAALQHEHVTGHIVVVSDPAHIPVSELEPQRRRRAERNTEPRTRRERLMETAHDHR